MADLYNQYIGLALTDGEVKSLTGWPDPLVQDYTSLLNSLRALASAIEYMQVGNGDPNGSVKSNSSRQYFDQGAGVLYCNPAIGMLTGWVAV